MSVPRVALNGGSNLDTMAKTHTCEVAGCDRDVSTDVATIDREGTAAVLVVCEACANAWNIGKAYAEKTND